MREVIVKKSELLERVIANRVTHIQEYKEACDGYREKALTKIEKVFGDLKKRIGELREGQVIALMAVTFGLEVPESHEADYDQVIEMLRMSTEDTIKLASDEFACYVMDDWAWKKAFIANSTMYKNR